jgi:hypothetical protein
MKRFFVTFFPWKNVGVGKTVLMIWTILLLLFFMPWQFCGTGNDYRTSEVTLGTVKKRYNFEYEEQ